jgi:hypothetical protein
MKGETKLEVTHATMVEAMQEYLDKRLAATKQRVTAVEKKRSDYGQDAFIVTITEADAPPVAP